MAAEQHITLQRLILPSASTLYHMVPTKAGTSKRDEHLNDVGEDASDIWIPTRTLVNDDTSIQSRMTKRRSAHMLLAWIPEVISAVLGSISLLAIVIVLRIYDGQALNSLGLPKYLTLNGLIAAIATLLRVFMVVPVASALSQEGWLWLRQNKKCQSSDKNIRLKDLTASDAASRGAWGSLILLCSSHRTWLAWLGALVTVLSLAIGTFTQQLISNTNVAVASSKIALTPGNVPWSNLYDDFSGNAAEGNLLSTLPVKAAAYNGFMSNNITALQVSCPTGNCTFPQTPSIAICGSCAATTNTVDGCNATNCNYTTSLGTIFTMPNLTGPVGIVGVGFQTILNDIVDDILLGKNNLTMVDFEMLGVPYGYTQGREPQDNGIANYSSSHCKVWYCVNVYNTSVSNGYQQQTIVESYSDIPNTPADKDANYADTWNITVPPKWNSTIFGVTVRSFEALQNQLNDMILGDVTLNTEGFSASSDGVQAVWRGSNNTEEWIERVTLSLTNVARSLNGQTRADFNGTSFTPGIGVRWSWIALPALLMVMTFIVLVSVVVRTARSDIGVWKGSPLTMLLFDIDRDLRRQLDENDSRQVSRVVGDHLANARVRLWRTDRGRFRLKTT